MTENWSAQRWANTVTQVLDVVKADDRYPVNVPEVAKAYSEQVFPDDPITKVKGDVLPGFEGGLYPAPKGKKGWGIFYNTAIASQGRINFTLAHEFGHYLAHRRKFPDGIRCDPKAMLSWDSESAQVEAEANAFAAGILMPLHDFRHQIAPNSQPALDEIGACAARYDVSLAAAALRWLTFTTRRSVLVLSRDGFVLWARSSEAAVKSGAYLRTKNVAPVAISDHSLAARTDASSARNEAMDFGPEVWFGEPSHEQVLRSDRFDFALSLIHLDDAARFSSGLDQDPTRDAFDHFETRPRARLGDC